jgi:hypothetical protein
MAANILAASTARSTTINTTSQLCPLEEIQISENEMASDPDRHRSLSRHRRVLGYSTHGNTQQSQKLDLAGTNSPIIISLFSHTQVMR